MMSARVSRPSGQASNGHDDQEAGATEPRREGESHFPLAAIVNLAMDAVIILNHKQRIVLFNPAAEQIFGYTEAEMLGQLLKRLLPERFQAPVRQTPWLCDPTSNAGGPKEPLRGLYGLRANGERFPAEASICGLAVNGRPCFTLILRDVTGQRRLETQLRQSQKMAALGQLASGVAHDFNNLLTVIAGHSDLLARMAPPEGPLRESVAEIQRAAERAAALTGQLLAFSRKQVLAPRALDLNAVVTGARNMLRRLIGENVQLVTLLQPDVSRVRVDPGEIDQVIMNLAINARDAMPRGGCLGLETRNVELDAAYAQAHAGVRPGRHVLLAITDKGCGMTPAVQARLFEPFFTTKARGQGTGLGLSIVQRIIRQSGGHLAVYSAAGVGTTFKIYLPAVDDEALPPASGAASEPVQGRETILLVEDEPPVRQITVRLLKALGYRVLEAACGEDALRLMEAGGQKVELLMTDVLMPGMSGGELARALRGRHPALKVLFQTGYTDEALVRHGLLKAEVALVQKPFTLDSLARKVREALGGP